MENGTSLVEGRRMRMSKINVRKSVKLSRVKAGCVGYSRFP